MSAKTLTTTTKIFASLRFGRRAAGSFDSEFQLLKLKIAVGSFGSEFQLQKLKIAVDREF